MSKTPTAKKPTRPPRSVAEQPLAFNVPADLMAQVRARLDADGSNFSALVHRINADYLDSDPAVPAWAYGRVAYSASNRRSVLLPEVTEQHVRSLYEAENGKSGRDVTNAYIVALLKEGWTATAIARALEITTQSVNGRATVAKGKDADAYDLPPVPPRGPYGRVTNLRTDGEDSRTTVRPDVEQMAKVNERMDREGAHFVAIMLHGLRRYVDGDLPLKDPTGE